MSNWFEGVGLQKETHFDFLGKLLILFIDIPVVEIFKLCFLSIQWVGMSPQYLADDAGFFEFQPLLHVWSWRRNNVIGCQSKLVLMQVAQEAKGIHWCGCCHWI